MGVAIKDFFMIEFSQEVKVLLTAMVPMGELRVALPLALISYRMSLAVAYVLSVLGNIIPVFFLLLFWRYAAEYCQRKFKICDRFFKWLFERTKKKFEGKYQRWGKLALVIFVAIPLPGTGAWTGSLAAWIFGFKYWESLILNFIGVCLAGIIVGLLTIGGLNLF